MPLRQVSARVGVPLTTVSDHLRRAARAGLKWPLPGELDDAGLEALLYPPGPAPEPTRPVPDWARVHTELRRKGVTLQLLWVEYREAYPDGYGYSQFACFTGPCAAPRRDHAPVASGRGEAVRRLPRRHGPDLGPAHR